MGKALVVGVVIVILALLATFLVVWISRRTGPGDLSRHEEQKLKDLCADAARFMYELGWADSIEESDVLSEKSRAARDHWMNRYSQIRKGIDA